MIIKATTNPNPILLFGPKKVKTSVKYKNGIDNKEKKPRIDDNKADIKFLLIKLMSIINIRKNKTA